MAGHQRKFLTPAMCAVVAVFGVWSEAFCQLAVNPSTEEVRVGVQLKRLNGDPIDHLSVDDFRVSIGTQMFPLTLARPALKKNTPDSVPTRLLVLFSPPATRGANDPIPQVIENLKPIWSRGWQVSLLTPEGQLTPYASSATELQQLVRQNAGPAKTCEEALQTLQTFPGRRLIVYMSDGQHKAPDGLAQAAHLTEGTLYDVGGDIFRNYTYGEAEKGSTPSLPSYGTGLYGPSPGPAIGDLTVVNNVETWSAPAQLSIGDVHNERRFKGAISDAIRDAGNYYELRLRVPSQTAWLVLGVTLKGDYRLTAQAYTLGDNKPPGLVLLRSKP